MTDFDEFENVFKWYCFVVGTLANTLALCLLFKRISTLSKRFFKVDSSDRHQQQQQQLEQQQHRHQHFLQVPSQSRFPTATTNNNDANNIATTTPTSSNTNKHYVTIRKSTLIERRYNQTIYLYYFGIIASDLVILLNWAFSQILIGHDSEIRLVVENDTFFASPSDFDFDSSEGGGGGGGGGFVTKAHQPNIITLTTEHYQPYLYLLEKSKYLNFTATHSLIPSAYDQVSPSSSSSSSSSSNFTSATGPLRLVDVDLVNRSTPFSLDTVNHSAMFFESIVTALNAQLRHSTIKLVDLQVKKNSLFCLFRCFVFLEIEIVKLQLFQGRVSIVLLLDDHIALRLDRVHDHVAGGPVREAQVLAPRAGAQRPAAAVSVVQVQRGCIVCVVWRSEY